MIYTFGGAYKRFTHVVDLEGMHLYFGTDGISVTTDLSRREVILKIRANVEKIEELLRVQEGLMRAQMVGNLMVL